MKKNIIFMSMFCLTILTSLFVGAMSVSPKLISFADNNKFLYNSFLETNSENLSSTENKIILVNGSATVKVSPDTANVTIGLESCGETLSEVLDETNSKLANMIEYLKSNNIEETSIKTQNFSIYQRYESTLTEKNQIYCVNSMLEFSTKELESLETLISGLTEMGANRLNGITFTSSDLSQYYNDALKQALENAEIKASALTSENLSVCFIKEDCSHSYIPLRTLSTYEQKQSVAPGLIEISANVLVKFKTSV